MKKVKIKMNYLTIAVLVAAVIGLGSCSKSSSGGGTTPPPVQESVVTPHLIPLHRMPWLLISLLMQMPMIRKVD